MKTAENPQGFDPSNIKPGDPQSVICDTSKIDGGPTVPVLVDNGDTNGGVPIVVPPPLRSGKQLR